MGLQEVRSFPRTIGCYLFSHGMTSLATRTFMFVEGFEHVDINGVQFWFHPSSTQNKKKTIFFIHGIGGLVWYLPFVRHLKQRHDDYNIICLTLPYISLTFPLFKTSTTMEDTVAATKILFERNQIENSIFIGHSFGTGVVANIIKSTPNLVSKAIFIDPICFELAKPDVIYNFVYRFPEDPISLVMWYYVSKEIGVASFICREFYWFQHILFAHQLPHPAQIFLSGKDQIVNSNFVKKYLSVHNKDTHYERDHLHGAFLFDTAMWNRISDSMKIV